MKLRLELASQRKRYVIQLTMTLKMTTAQVVETLVTVNNNSPIQDYVHPDDRIQPTSERKSVKNHPGKNYLAFTVIFFQVRR